MDFAVKFTAPEGWISEQENCVDEYGVETIHVECHKKEEDPSLIDIYVGEMPDDSDAFDQAFANYADLIGFDDDDDESFNPISEWKFNGRKAYGFDATCEDESPMRVICSEIKKGILLVMCVVAAREDEIATVVGYAERGLRVQIDS